MGAEHYLWAAAYSLLPDFPPAKPADKPAPAVIARRGKKAARAKREKAAK